MKSGGGELTYRGVAKGLQAIANAPNSPIERTDNPAGIATRWRWREQHPREQHPLRSLAFRDEELLQQTLLYKVARRFIPPVMADNLENDRACVASKLTERPDSQLSWWLQHVAHLPEGPPRFPKPLDEAVVQEVSKALWNRRQLQVEYRRGGLRDWSPIVLHPQGLVLVEEVLWLIAVSDDFTEPYSFSLMRMRQAQMLPGDSRKIEGFDFKHHVAKEFNWPYGEARQIEFWVHEEPKIEFEEMPISEDQKIDPNPNARGYYRVTATVVPNVRLDNFLRKFGDRVYREVRE